ncbi:PID-CTERM protein-sorting domain-containing protein [Urechidicola croceus]|uniref:PID-CTERM protein-sorting domain-containing protein n=1 Tax=Urechidicola croceus TaxID=1850246 RepID=UPI0012E9A5EB|nr:hypothetical protein [Urechidicola croceus]
MKFRPLLILAMYFVMTTSVFSQLGPPGGGPGGGSGPNPSGPGLPIDGGIVLLLASGIVYGANKLRDKEE